MFPTQYWKDFIITRIKSGYDDATILQALNAVCRCAIPDADKHTAMVYQGQCDKRKLAHIQALRAGQNEDNR